MHLKKQDTTYAMAYISASYSSPSFNANIGASVFGSIIKRWDRYNYVGDDVISEAACGTGASVKAGVLWKINRGHSLYANGGWYSRLPYSNVWFSSGNNEITKGVRNERNTLGEVGWRWVWASGNVELTGINMRNAVNIGMFPDVELEKFHYIGNSSLTGAYAMVMSDEATAKTAEVAANMTYLELSTHPGYMDSFVAACFIPHTDSRLFPNSIQE